MAKGEIMVSYWVSTPMACRGADPAKSEPRAASFRGVLRFWWRAVAWGMWGGDELRVRQWEEKLFGSAQQGRGMVGIEEMSVSGKPESLVGVGEGIRYLAGMGLVGSRDREGKERGRAQRSGGRVGPVWRASRPLVVRLRLRHLKRLKEQELKEAEESVVLALEALGTFGGMGARSRRGWGSMCMVALNAQGITGREWNLKGGGKLEEVVGRVRCILDRCIHLGRGDLNKLPSYTALSPATKVVVAEMLFNNDPLKLLEEIGREMSFYRSGFTGDSQMVSKGKGIPSRSVFGLPLPFFFPSSKEKYTVVAEIPHEERSSRRASPLFVHIHQLKRDQHPVVVLTFLPAVFLPEDSKIAVKKDERRLVSEEWGKEGFWEPVECFLLRLVPSKEGSGECDPRLITPRHKFHGKWAWPVSGG